MIKCWAIAPAATTLLLNHPQIVSDECGRCANSPTTETGAAGAAHPMPLSRPGKIALPSAHSRSLAKGADSVPSTQGRLAFRGKSNLGPKALGDPGQCILTRSLLLHEALRRTRCWLAGQLLSQVDFRPAWQNRKPSPAHFKGLFSKTIPDSAQQEVKE